ncbi:hypothetical protein B8W72_23770 [Pseudomonas putida]|uniref:Uncharacterized protein n=1 Tax=Pseudomonas putida TaxID=303 RepID=A0A1Y3KK63_PSEPU|nr:hypothetical protein B8W72_23770 [Pseudomonas putida]
MHHLCGSGLVSRKGCKAAPATSALQQQSRGRSAALSRHKAAPTKSETAHGLNIMYMPRN